MIDTNIFDKLIQDSFFPDIWQSLEARLLCFVTTEIQEEEINNISDSRRKKLLQSIPRQVIPLAINNIDEVEKHLNDRLIAETAVQHCDLFVTEDRQLQEWYQAHFPNHQSWNYQEFIVWFLNEVYPLI